MMDDDAQNPSAQPDQDRPGTWPAHGTGSAPTPEPEPGRQTGAENDREHGPEPGPVPGTPAGPAADSGSVTAPEEPVNPTLPATPPEQTDAEGGSRTGAPTGSGPAPRRRIRTRTRVLIAVLTMLVGFAAVIQVRQTQDDELSTMRQDDLVRLLDEVTQRNEDLTSERSQLRLDRSNLQSGSDQGRYLRNYATLQGILAGTVAVEGPGVRVRVDDPDHAVTAQEMVHMLEELRNAGAEAIEVSGVRIVAVSYFVDAGGGLLTDGQVLSPPYQWLAIGNPETLAGALEIPGGALAGFRNAGASVQMTTSEALEIDATRSVTPPEHATPVTDE